MGSVHFLHTSKQDEVNDSNFIHTYHNCRLHKLTNGVPQYELLPQTHTHINIYIRRIYHCSYKWTGRNSEVLSQHCTTINHLTACNERRLLVILSCQLLTWDNNSLTIVVMIQQTGSGSPSGERTWSRDKIQPLAAKLYPTCSAVRKPADSWIGHYVIIKLPPAYLPKQANTTRKPHMAFCNG